jgi:cellulose biosynthesis protein BcsQ
MEVVISNEELGQFLGKTEGAIRYMREHNPDKYAKARNKYIKKIESDMKSISPFVVMLFMFKGGVGKSALSHIINENLSKFKSVLLNLDLPRDVKEYTSLEAINFSDFLEDEPDMSPSELIDELKAVCNYVVVDTPGEVSAAYTIDAIKSVDLFVMPFGLDKEEKDMIITTLNTTLLSDLELYPPERTLNLLFVLNNYRDDSDIQEAKEFMKKVQNEIDERDSICSKVNVTFTYLKYSKAIITMKKTRKSISDLSSEHFIAYRLAKKRIKQFTKDVKMSIKLAKEE